MTEMNTIITPEAAAPRSKETAAKGHTAQAEQCAEKQVTTPRPRAGVWIDSNVLRYMGQAALAAGLLAAPAMAQSTNISGCAEITTGGTYTLTANVFTRPANNLPCFNIHDTGGQRVTLDCQSHTIQYDTTQGPGYSAGSGTPFFFVVNAPVTFTQCIFTNTGAMATIPHYFLSSPTSVILCSTLTNVDLYPRNSPYFQFYASTSNGGRIFFQNSDWSYVYNSTMDQTHRPVVSGCTANCFDIVDYSDSNNGHVMYSTLIGQGVLTDDGIVFYKNGITSGDIGNTVQYSHISHVNDVCIEWAGRHFRQTVTDTTCDSAANAAFGGWYGISFEADLYRNTATNTPALFDWFYASSPSRGYPAFNAADPGFFSVRLDSNVCGAGCGLGVSYFTFDRDYTTGLDASATFSVGGGSVTNNNFGTGFNIGRVQVGPNGTIGGGYNPSGNTCINSTMSAGNPFGCTGVLH